MYRVYCNGKTIHDVRDEEFRLLSPKLALELNKTGNLDFGILPSHPGIRNIERLKSSIEVYDESELLYSGRPINDEADFYNLGQVMCEGELSFLLDSVQRPKSYGSQTGNGKTNIDIFRKLLEVHNEQVEDGKRFELGIIDIDPVEVKSVSTNYEKTWDFLNSNFIGKYDGYLRVRHSGNKRYLDYVKQYGKVSAQEIRFGENLLDLKRYIKAENIVTAIIPVGKNNVTVKTANGHNGTDYVYDPAAVEMYGWIYEKVDFSDVNDPDTLLKRAKEELKTRINLAISIELTAADLHLIDVDINAIRLGDLVPCISERHGLLSTPGDVSTYYLVSKYELNLDNPSNNKITLGRTISTLTAQVAGTTSASEKVNAVSESVSYALKSADKAVEKVTVIEEQMNELADKYYPVGSILQIMEKNYDPNMHLGGRWERIKGRVLVGVDEQDESFQISGKTGGEKEHVLTISELPPHDHSGETELGGESVLGYVIGAEERSLATNSTQHLHGIKSQGEGQAHNNLQPYITCYTWTKTGAQEGEYDSTRSSK